MEVSLKPTPAWNSALDTRHKATRQTPVLAIVFSEEVLRMDRTRLPHIRALNHDDAKPTGTRMPSAAEVERWTRDEGALCRPTNSAMEAAEYPELTEMLMRRCERSCGNDTLGPLLISSTNGEIRPGYRAFVLARPSRSVKTSSTRKMPSTAKDERLGVADCTSPGPLYFAECMVGGVLPLCRLMAKEMEEADGRAGERTVAFWGDRRGESWQWAR